MTLAPIDPHNEVAVTSYLQQARDWLTRAVDETGPEQIAAAKAEIATAAEATRQLGLSKEIQLDAQEMVRRAEYALSKSIRKGQAEGTIATRADNPGPRSEYERNGYKVRPSDRHNEETKVSVDSLIGSGGRTRNDILNLAADTSDGAFDAAIDEAKAEGNLSRANVARKAREKSGAPEPAPAGTTERNHQEAELINAFASIVRRSLTKKNVATLSHRARQRLIAILTDAIETLEGTDHV